MAKPALRPPSFRLRKSAIAVLSDSGQRLVQIGQRVVVWNVPGRKVNSEFKVMSNEWHVAISPDDCVVAVKGENGELVFCETETGRVISKSLKNGLAETGCRPQFSNDSRFLVDGCWDGSLRIWDVATAKEIARAEHRGYMVTNIVAARGAGYFFVSLAKIGDGGGGSRILQVPSANLTSSTELLPAAGHQSDAGGWRSIERIAVNRMASHIAVALLGKSMTTPNSIESLHLPSGATSAAILPSRMHFVRGLACTEGGLTAAAVNENLHRSGMSFTESTQVRASTEHSHLHFYESASMSLLARWYWPDAWMLSCSPSQDWLAVASRDEPGAYLANYEFKAATGNALRSSGFSRQI